MRNVFTQRTKYPHGTKKSSNQPARAPVALALPSIFAGLAALFVVCPPPADCLEIPLLWTTNVHAYTESGPTVADVDGDGLAETIVASQEEIIVLKGTGEIVWRWRTRGRYMTYPSILQRSGEPTLIFACDMGGMLTCLTGSGEVEWQLDLKAPSCWSAPALGDLDGDGAVEVVQTDEMGAVRSFDAESGDVKWEASIANAPASPALGDVNNDGKLEVALTTTMGTVFLLASQGGILWKREIGGTSETWGTCAPVMFSSSSGAGRIVSASSEGRVFCFDADGTTAWEQPVRGAVAPTISAGDFDLDGRPDIFLITQLGVIHRFDEDGAVLWNIDMQGRSLAAGAIIDLDHDGRLEYALSTQDGHLMVLNSDGRTVFDHQFENRTINVTPAFGDVTKDSPGLEMLITGGESGRVFCFGTKAPVDTLAQWTAYRGNEHKTGTWFGLASETVLRMSPENLASDQVLSGESVRFHVVNPAPGDEPIKASATCVRPDGARIEAVTKVLGKHGVLDLPVEVLATGTYCFAWTLTDGAGRPLFSGNRDLVLDPFQNDRAIAKRALAALRDAARAAENTLPLSAEALRREGDGLEREIGVAVTAQETVPGGGVDGRQVALQKTSTLVARAKQGLGLSTAVQRAVDLGPGTSTLVSEGDLWESRAREDELPTLVSNPVQLRRRMVQGEHEPISLDVLNILDRPVQARVVIDTPADGPVVTPYRSMQLLTSVAEPIWDPLLALDESAVVTIPSLKSGEVWLDIDGANAVPGEYKVTVKILALNGAGVVDGPKNPRTILPPVATVEISLNVLPFEMAPSGVFRLCTWPALDATNVSDLLAHGNNVFIGPNAESQYDAAGTLTGFDYTKLDAFANQFSGHDVVLMLNGIPSFRGQPGSTEFTRDMKAYLDDLVPHMAALGFDTDHFALYPIDEPGGQGWDAVNRVVEFGKAVRAANPKVMVYVDGGGELPMFQAMADYIDIWCPGIGMLADESPEMEIMRTHGKLLWSYDCGYSYARPVGSCLKGVNIVAQYRTSALFAFRHGGTGIGYWCYNSGDDPWGRVQLNYPLVYPGLTRPVVSRRWEAVREGIEDYRILAVLRKRLTETDGTSITPTARSQITHLIEVSLPEMLDQSFGEVKMGLARTSIDATNNDAAMRALRSEMLGCVEALTACAS